MTTNLNRRAFMRDTVLVACGGAGGIMLPGVLGCVAAAKSNPQASGGHEERLRKLGITLPPAPKPVAVYVPAVVSGDTLYASGHGPRRADGTMIKGKVGGGLTLKQGYDAARVVGLNVLSTVRNTLGSLDKVVRLVKVLGMVNCTPDFTKQPQVINGFSELMVQVFGDELGRGARSAVGMGALPSNIPVEIEAIFEVRS